MDQEAILQYVTGTFAGVMLLRPTDGPGAGDAFIYYDPEHDLDLTRSMPFATIVAKDYKGFDESSQLDRPGVFRLNINVARDTFQALFGFPPAEVSTVGYDFSAFDQVMPHPAYGRQSWVCILNPSEATFETVKPLLAEAYAAVGARYARRRAGHDEPDR
jgi:hypothetical protein